MIDLIGGGTKTGQQLLNMRQSEAVTVSIFFRLPCPPPLLPKGILYSPQFSSHQETKMAAPSDSTIVIYDLTEKKGPIGLNNNIVIYDLTEK